MNEATFTNWANAEGIRSDAYAIGKPRDEAYVAERRLFGWSVYYFERGLRRDMRKFSNELDALADLARRLAADPLTRPES